MKIVDVGSGTPIVLVPGVQGHWEWMRPAVDALAKHCRVITFSLADEPTSAGRFDETAGISSYVDQIAEALDAAKLQRAVICGVSYGGLVAASFAVRHPERTVALVLVSALAPSWKPDARVRLFLRAPHLLFPLFSLLAALRLYREIATAVPGFLAGVAAASRHGFTALVYMLSPGRVARRVYLLESRRGIPSSAEFELANAPTLVITGEPWLDRVVPVALTREYLRIWPHAESVTLPRTGHLGLITRSEEFARILATFVEAVSQRDTPRRSIV